MTRRPFAAGNWKMNGLGSSLEAIKALVASIGSPDCDVAICPPATLLQSFAAATNGTAVGIGAQDCHDAVSGAHTGDISAEMIADAGAAYVIVGHSERRADHGETDADVAAKAEAVWRAGLVAIVCVGETEAERDAGAALDVVAKQLSGSLPDGATGKNTVVAYEPVWAIGTGRTPSLDDIAEVHAAMRSHNLVTKDMRLLYGGSVKPANAAEIFAVPDVDGGLVGGASLKPADFAPIVAAASAAAR